MEIGQKLGDNFGRHLYLKRVLKENLRTIARPTARKEWKDRSLNIVNECVLALWINRRVHDKLLVEFEEEGKRLAIFEQALTERLKQVS